MPVNDKNLIWIDMEMTGLDPERDRIIEIEKLVNEDNMDILEEGMVLEINQ